MQSNTFRLTNLLLAVAFLFSLTSAAPVPRDPIYRPDDVTFRPSDVKQFTQKSYVFSPSDTRVGTTVLGTDGKPAKTRAPWDQSKPEKRSMRIEARFEPNNEDPEQKRSADAVFQANLENSLRGETKVYQGSLWR
jgi:hypothetical protein